MKVAGFAAMMAAGIGFFPVFALVAGEGDGASDPWWYLVVVLGWLGLVGTGVGLFLAADKRQRG